MHEHTRGGRKISGLFGLSKISLFFFSRKFLLILVQSISHLRPNTFAIFLGVFAFPLHPEIDLLLRYRFTAEIKVAMVSYLFPASFLVLETNKIERKAIIRNQYNYPTPPIRDIKGKETQTRNNWTLIETSLTERQTDSYFPTKWPNGYPKQKRCKRHTISKTNYNKNKP